MKLKFLGTSDSAGMPVHNCFCKACDYYRSKNLKNLSTCAYLEFDDYIILLDAGIENISNIFDKKRIKAVFLTHFHADHCLGLLRLRHSKDNIDCFHPKDKMGFSDLFKYKYSINYRELKAFEKIELNDVCFTPVPLIHSKNTFGYLIEYLNTTIIYLTDCAGLSKETFSYLRKKDIDYAFIDACYDERKNVGNHLNYNQASKILDELNLKYGFLMHISHTTKEYIMENKILLKYNYLDFDSEFLFPSFI